MDNKIENFIRGGIGVGVGYGVVKVADNGILRLRKSILDKTKPTPPKEKLPILRNTAIDIYNKLDIKKNGIEIHDLSKMDFDSYNQTFLKPIIEEFDQKINKSIKPIKWIIKRNKNKKIKYWTEINKNILDGKNALFSSSPKGIIINMDKSPHMLLHEIGHYIDYSTNPLLKNGVIHKLTRMQKPLALYITALTLITNKKPNPEVQDIAILRTDYKVRKFIKDNCFWLVSLTYLPTLYKESRANIIAQQIAKKHIPDKSILKEFTKAHIYSAGSYAFLMAVLGAGLYIGNSIRDFIAEGDRSKVKTRLSKMQLKKNK